VSEYAKYYSNVVQYGAKEIREARYGTPLTQELGTMLYAGMGGDNTPILALADRLYELGHPAADIMQKIGSGQYEIEHYNTHLNPINYYNEENIRTLKDSGYSLVPSANIIFPYAEGDLYPNTAYAELRYLKHPTGHYWNVELQSSDQNPERAGRRQGRSFMIPTTPEEVQQYAKEIEEADPEFSKHLLKTLNATESEPSQV